MELRILCINTHGRLGGEVGFQDAWETEHGSLYGFRKGWKLAHVLWLSRCQDYFFTAGVSHDHTSLCYSRVWWGSVSLWGFAHAGSAPRSTGVQETWSEEHQPGSRPPSGMVRIS